MLVGQFDLLNYTGIRIDITRTGHTSVHDDLDASPSGAASFLDRERAALGDDADLFATPSDNMATVEDAGDDDDDDDLLGGGGHSFQTDGATSDFETAFPSIDTTNDVSSSDGQILGGMPGIPE